MVLWQFYLALSDDMGRHLSAPGLQTFIGQRFEAQLITVVWGCLKKGSNVESYNHFYTVDNGQICVSQWSSELKYNILNWEKCAHKKQIPTSIWCLYRLNIYAPFESVKRKFIFVKMTKKNWPVWHCRPRRWYDETSQTFLVCAEDQKKSWNK